MMVTALPKYVTKHPGAVHPEVATTAAHAHQRPVKASLTKSIVVSRTAIISMRVSLSVKLQMCKQTVISIDLVGWKPRVLTLIWTQ
jgi:hypothetical protein